MPTLFPANPLWGDQMTIHYQEITSFTITYLTEKSVVEAYLSDRVVVPRTGPAFSGPTTTTSR
jgi:hypothetical protein